MVYLGQPDIGAIKDVFLNACPRVDMLLDYVYHGTSVDGMKGILAAREVKPAQHAELKIPAFCVSLNGGVSSAFARDDGGDEHGAVFTFWAQDLRCRELSPFFYSLMAVNDNHFRWSQHIQKHPEDEHLAETLGLECYGGYRLTPEIFNQIVPRDVDGICLPGWADSSGEVGNEQEISILAASCPEMAKQITQISYCGDVFTFDEAIEKFAPELPGRSGVVCGGGPQQKRI